jgi:hypothetical protein
MAPNPTPPPGELPHVAALKQSLTDLIAESQALRVDVHSAENARKKANRINLAMLALLGLFVVMLVGVTWQNNSLAHEVAKTNRTLADCLDPGGDCYRQGNQRTGAAIQDIIRAEIFMAECARMFPNETGPAYDRKLEACVFERLAGPGLRSHTNPMPEPSAAPTPSVPAPAPSTTR